MRLGYNSAMPRFVVLHHDFPAGHARRPHWDLMLEWGQSLRTWAVASEPGGAIEIEAEALPDHRLAYLDYEGPLSGNRGSVTRWDAGPCDWLADEADRVELDVRGAKLRGRAVLRSVNGAWIFRLTASAG